MSVVLVQDESDVEKQEEFERKFNFRFEEPDAEFVSTGIINSFRGVYNVTFVTDQYTKIHSVFSWGKGFECGL